MPDRSQFFVFSRTVDRPTWGRRAHDNRLAVAKGCAAQFTPKIGYSESFSMTDARMTQIGITCRICPRANCDPRAHQAAILTQPVIALRRGVARFGES